MIELIKTLVILLETDTQNPGSNPEIKNKDIINFRFKSWTFCLWINNLKRQWKKDRFLMKLSTPI